MATVKFSGEITRTALTKKMVPGVQGVVNDVGAFGLYEVRQHVPISSRHTYDTLTWQTSTAGTEVGSNATQKDKLDKPTEMGVVVVGSGDPRSVYIELGTERHMSKEGHEEFVARLKEWFRREIGGDPDSPEFAGAFKALYHKIRTQGTKAQPFVEPSFDPIMKYAKKKIAAFLSLQRNKGK